MALAAGNEVVIGDIDDLSGVCADVISQGGIEAGWYWDLNAETRAWAKR